MKLRTILNIHNPRECVMRFRFGDEKMELIKLSNFWLSKGAGFSSMLNKSVFVLVACLFLAFPAHAAKLKQISIDDLGVPFLLDDAGHVWSFRNVEDMEGLFRLPALENIQSVEPYIAVDNKGRVYTWGLDEKKIVLNEKDADKGASATLSKIGFTTPRPIAGVDHVTKVKYHSNYYFAVINNEEIVAWPITRSKSNWGIEGIGVVKKIFQRKGIIAMDVAPGYYDRVIVSDPGFGLVVLMEDGSVYGKGITSAGQYTRRAKQDKEFLLTKQPGATAVAINLYHTVVLTKEGIPKFWGGCSSIDEGGTYSGIVVDTPGRINNAVSMAIARSFWIVDGGNDNQHRNTYIKIDGSVWKSSAPAPEDTGSRKCDMHITTYESLATPEQAKEIYESASQAVAGAGRVIVLDKQGGLWLSDRAGESWDFKKLQVNIE